MITQHDAQSLQAFEADIAEQFNAGRIRAPVHLSGGNEDALLQIFQAVGTLDYIATTWRSHYHCLLKDVPPQALRADILAGRSITLNYPAQRVVSSAIVGGALPIALGIAWKIKASRGALGASPGDAKVWAFVGDMAAETGIFSECVRYADAHGLPIRFVVEDNGISVCTPTREAWGWSEWRTPGNVTRYRYTLPWPHAGAGKRVEF